MAQASIGRAALQLYVDGTRLNSGLSAASSRIKKFHQDAEGASDSGGSVTRNIPLIIGRIGKAGALAGAAFGTAFVAAFSVSKIIERLDEIRKVGITSKVMGMDPGKGAGFFGMLAANSAGDGSTKENIETLVQMSTKIKEMLDGAKPDSEASKLFKDLSVSAKELEGLDPAEQFYRLHAAIMQLRDPMERMNKLGLMGGTDALKVLLPVLDKTTEQLRKQAAGFEISKVGMMESMAASAQYNAGLMAMQSAWDRVVVAMSPAVELLGRVMVEAADRFKDRFTEWEPRIMPIIWGVARGIASIYDSFVAVLGAVKVFAGGITAAFGLLLLSVAGALKALTKLADQLPDSVRPDWTRGMGEGVLRTADDMLAKGEAAMKDGVAGMKAWGSSIEWVDQNMAQMMGRRIEAQNNLNGLLIQGGRLESEFLKRTYGKAVSGFEFGSKEAWEVEANFRSPGILKDAGKQQVDQLKQVNKNLMDIKNKPTPMIPLGKF